MKDGAVSVAGVVLLALGLGLAFRWLYPQVELTGELAGLFLFVAVALKWIATRLQSLRRKPAAPPGETEVRK